MVLSPFSLGDMLDSTLQSWQPRAEQQRAAVFGAAGARGFDADRELVHLTGSARSAYGEVDPFHRLFSTDVGQAAVQAVGNETRTLAAMERLAVEVVAECLRRTDQLRDEDRLVVVPSHTGRPPVLLIMSPVLQYAWESRVVSDDYHLPLAGLSHALPVVADADNTPEGLVMRALLHGGDRALSETFFVAQPEIVLTRRPRMVRLCVPAPHIQAECNAELSTAGIYCRDKDGALGVTACYHGTGPVGTKVTVGGQPSYVKWANEVQDIVFIPVECAGPTRRSGGVRKDREPARADRGSFDGATNQNKTTRIFGTDNGLLRERPTIMLKVQTEPDTDQGDSGCALIDRDDQVLGFAFERTAYDDFPQFTDWIWAANALRALALSPI